MTATAEVASQQMQALDVANKIRLDRAALRRDIAALPRLEGRARIAELLADPPACIHSMLVVDLLRWPQRVGMTAALRLCKLAEIGEHERIAGPYLRYVGSTDRSSGVLSERQRAVLRDLLLEGQLKEGNR